MPNETPRGPLRICRLRRAELPTDTIELSKYLIGKTLVHDLPRVRLSGRIVETEAYPVGDMAAHAYKGLTPSRRSLFLPHGHAYVYFTYGSCFMMNVSSEIANTGAGVLLRALEPLEGIAFMQRRRGTTCLLDLARGPGRLAQAMAIDKRLDGVNLCARGDLWLGDEVRRTGSIGTTTRIGITRDVHRPYRFYERGSPFVSGPKRSRK
jgi:DNA-3-methyladenine glycosylase